MKINKRINNILLSLVVLPMSEPIAPSPRMISPLMTPSNSNDDLAIDTPDRSDNTRAVDESTNQRFIRTASITMIVEKIEDFWDEVVTGRNNLIAMMNAHLNYVPFSSEDIQKITLVRDKLNRIGRDEIQECVEVLGRL